MKQKQLLLRVAHEYDMLMLVIPLTQETLQFLHTCKTFAKETSSKSKGIGLDLYTMNFGFYEFDVYEDAVSLSDILDEKGDGFTAIVAALLGRLNPYGTLIAAFGFAALVVGADSMQRVAKIESSTVFVIEGLVLMFLLAGGVIGREEAQLS